MDSLVPKTVTLSTSHIEHAKKVAGNLSRYIRTLIDRDIGEQKGKLLAGGGELKNKHEEVIHQEEGRPEVKETEQTEIKKSIVWNFPKN